MSDITYPSDNLIADTPNNVADVKAIKNTTESFLNSAGWIDTAKFADGSVTYPKLAANVRGNIDVYTPQGNQGRRGSVTIPTEDSTTSQTFMMLGDEVSDLYLPAHGLLFVAYSALWKATLTSTLAEASIFIEDQTTPSTVEVKIPPTTSTSPVSGKATLIATRDYCALSSSGAGLVTNPDVGGDAAAITEFAYVGVDHASLDSASSQRPRVGGVAAIAIPSTINLTHRFKVSVRYRVAGPSSTVYVKDRKLWVWTMF